MEIIKDLEININRMSEWVDAYYNWFDFNTRGTEPMAANNNSLVKAHYHEELGRNGYVAPESGSSEAQFLTLLGFIKMYKATKQLKWLGMAQRVADAAINFLYIDEKFPDETFNEAKLFAPHWLFNASKPFKSDAFYQDKIFSFTNGATTVISENQIKKLFKVIGKDSTLLWNDPFAKVIGTEFEIASHEITENNELKIQLKESYTGELKVIFSDLGGENIEVNQIYEAYPVWRKMEEKEIACACDSLWWSYHCWKELHSVTGSIRDRLLMEHTKELCIYSCALSNVRAYVKPQFDNFPIDDSMQINILTDNRDPVPVVSRDSEDGSIKLDIPKGIGIIDVHCSFPEDKLFERRTYKVDVTTDIPTAIMLELECVSSDGVNKKYKLVKWTKGLKVPESLAYDLKDFKDTTKTLFDLGYSPHIELQYVSDNSSVEFKDIEINGQLARQVDFKIGTEFTENGDAYLGWAQYHPTLQTYNFENDISITYKSTNSMEISFIDSRGYKWVKVLPKADELTTVTVNKYEFYLHEEQTEDGPFPSSPQGETSTLIFGAVTTEVTLILLRIGDVLEQTPFEKIIGATIRVTEEKKQVVKIHHLQPLPLDDYEYSPYIIPFTLNLNNGVLNDWRGMPYTGYQCPWFWQDVKSQEGVNVSLQFLRDAQLEYKLRTKKHSFFMPTFIWDRWDNLEFGEINKFSWNGADPNTFWGGYQYRTIETVAITLFNDNTLEMAKNIVYDFLSSLTKVWTDTKAGVPTTFNSDGSIKTEYRDSGSVGIVLRTCIYALQSGQISKKLCINLINKCLVYLDNIFVEPTIRNNHNQPNITGTWGEDNKFYQYWGGEILHSLAILFENTQNTAHVRTAEGNVFIDTVPEKFKEDNKLYASIQTPTGTQFAELVDINDERATSVFIKIDEANIKAIKGGETMSTYDLEIIKSNIGKSNLQASCDSAVTTLYKCQFGTMTILKIKGTQAITNTSPRQSYDYSTQGLYNNYFFLQPNQVYTLFCDFEVVGNTKIFMNEKDSSYSSLRDIDINADQNIQNNSRVRFTFKTLPNSYFVTFYSPTQLSTVKMNNIMIIKGDIQSYPDYFKGKLESFNTDVTLSVKSIDKKYSNVVNLKEHIDPNLLPLRINGEVFDEINEECVIKRIGDLGEILQEPLTYPLIKPFPLIGCSKDSWIELESDGHLPEVEITYPLTFKDAFECLRDNIDLSTSNAILGTFMLNSIKVGEGE